MILCNTRGDEFCLPAEIKLDKVVLFYGSLNYMLLGFGQKSNLMLNFLPVADANVFLGVGGLLSSCPDNWTRTALQLHLLCHKECNVLPSYPIFERLFLVRVLKLRSIRAWKILIKVDVRETWHMSPDDATSCTLCIHQVNTCVTPNKR